MKTVEITCGSYHVFGSGAASASLFIDGEKVTPTQDAGHNGFVGWRCAEVPVATLLKAKQVVWDKGATPGNTFKYEGSGKGFLRKYFYPVGKSDPLLTPFIYRPLYAKWLKEKGIKELEAIQKEREEKKKAVLASARPGVVEIGQLASGQLMVRRRDRPVKLHDGAAGLAWGEWSFV